MVTLSRLQALCLALLPTFAQGAEDAAARFELTPALGYGTGGDFEEAATGADLELGEDVAAGLVFNIQADVDTQWEILYLRQRTALAAGTPLVAQPRLGVDVHYLHGGGTYLFDGERVQPYVAGTIGLARFDPSPADLSTESYFSVSLGAGLRFLPSARIGVRLEGRLFATLVDRDREIFCRVGGASNVCAIQVDGSLVNQWHAFVGATFRF